MDFLRGAAANKRTRPSKRDFLELDGTFTCSFGTFKEPMEIQFQNLGLYETNGISSSVPFVVGEALGKENEEVSGCDSIAIVMVLDENARTVVADPNLTPPGKLQLDPRDFVDFEDPTCVSVACGHSQPEMKDACVGNSQPGLLEVCVSFVDCCAGSSQPLPLMKDESVETVQTLMEHQETMTSPEKIMSGAQKRFGLEFYADSAPDQKKRRVALGELCRVPFQQQQKDEQENVDYSLEPYTRKTLMYAPQINHDCDEDESESISSDSRIRVPAIRVGLSKKFRPPRLLKQYRTVPEPSQEDFYADEDKEN